MEGTPRCRRQGSVFLVNMKSLGRCGFILLGLPNIIGFAVVAALAVWFVRAVPANKRDMLFATVDVFTGLMSVFVGVYLIGLLQIAPNIWLPILAAAWFAIHFTRINRDAKFLRAAAGVLSGWWLYEFGLGA
jgi:hypothetical protein